MYEAEEGVPDVPVRLMIPGNDLQNLREGVVEVFLNDHWGFVLRIGQSEDNVLCKTLGFEYGGLPIYDKFIPGQGPLWIDYIECPLLANDLQDCEFDWKSEEDKLSIVYFDEEPAVVRCRTEPVEVPEVKFRLKAGQRGDMLEYFKDGYWGYVCGAYMGSSEASVFCHMLGFTYGGHIINNMDNGQYDGENDGRTDIAPTLLEYMECPWNSVDLNQCSEREWSHKDQRIVCKHHQRDLRLKCRSKPFPDYEVHLFGGNSINEGQLLVKYYNKLATVHPDYFSTSNITVVCKKLGFSNATAKHLPFDSQEIPATANNIQQVYYPRGASHLGDCFYGRLSFKNNGLSPWAPADCNEALRSSTNRVGVQCSI
ncbi:unnamed protein product [Mytilus edulis]|uniref:SRCR domain-containing protein n=1 Tax=Mytilus edulis TaxID=6550 RepID=A0A8S3VDV4_MYTED|nr:unnamed protein product [Mytilus edulis]